MDLIREERELRTAVAELGAIKERRRYGEALRLRLAAHVQARLACGEKLARIARSLDMPSATLARFGARRAFVRLSVKHDVAENQKGIRVHAPGGFVVEGLSLDELAELLSRFSCSD